MASESIVVVCALHLIIRCHDDEEGDESGPSVHVCCRFLKDENVS